jgi:signal transduction histidine kinase
VSKRQEWEETQRAILNILDDFGSEKSRLEETQRAILNILDDFGTEKSRLEEMQRAVLNILDDLNLSNEQLQKAHEVLEDRVKERTKELEAKTGELEQIIYVASHDLRSPLVNIHGYSKELTESLKEFKAIITASELPAVVKQRLTDIMAEDVQNSLNFIGASAIKMDSLLSGLLRLSRLGRASLNIEKIEMKQLMNEVIVTFEFQVRQAGAVFKVGDLPPCKGDKVQINQVFSNLIDNALKYLEPSRPGVIWVSGSSDGATVKYCVRDNGIGIAPQFHKQIFEIFRRLDPKKTAGEGLGLTIVRRILDRNSGKVWVESEPGKGSSFFVSLPSQQGRDSVNILKGAGKTDGKFANNSSGRR